MKTLKEMSESELRESLGKLRLLQEESSSLVDRANDELLLAESKNNWSLAQVAYCESLIRAKKGKKNG